MQYIELFTCSSYPLEKLLSPTQLAAHYLKDKKSALELLLSMSETAQEIDSSSESITPSVYVGQFAQLLEKGEAFTLHS